MRYFRDFRLEACFLPKHDAGLDADRKAPQNESQAASCGIKKGGLTLFDRQPGPAATARRFQAGNGRLNNLGKKPLDNGLVFLHD